MQSVCDGYDLKNIIQDKSNFSITFFSIIKLRTYKIKYNKMGVVYMQSFFKKIALLLVLIMCFNLVPNFANASAVTSESIPVYSSIEEWELSEDDSEIVRIQNENNRYLGGYTEHRFVESKKANDIRVGYHPDFPNWQYWDGYLFSTSSKRSFSPSVSVQWGVVSVGVSVARSTTSSGTYKAANVNKRSRPWVRADITTKFYDVYIYDDRGKLLQVNKKSYKKSTSSDIQIFIDHK